MIIFDQLFKTICIGFLSFIVIYINVNFCLVYEFCNTVRVSRWLIGLGFGLRYVHSRDRIPTEPAIGKREK